MHKLYYKAAAEKHTYNVISIEINMAVVESVTRPISPLFSAYQLS